MQGFEIDAGFGPELELADDAAAEMLPGTDDQLLTVPGLVAVRVVAVIVGQIDQPVSAGADRQLET